MTDERLPERDAETYLGDGLYVSLDGSRVWLRAPRPEGDHRIARNRKSARVARRGFTAIHC